VPVINEEHFPLSNYQYLYTSAFSSKNNSENTTVVKPNDDTLLHPFTNLQSDKQNQPHLVENTPTTEIVEHEAVKIHETSNLNSNPTANLNSACEGNDNIDSEICNNAAKIFTGANSHERNL
jgi:hypothetical protein